MEVAQRRLPASESGVSEVGNPVAEVDVGNARTARCGHIEYHRVMPVSEEAGSDARVFFER